MNTRAGGHEVTHSDIVFSLLEAAMRDQEAIGGLRAELQASLADVKNLVAVLPGEVHKAARTSMEKIVNEASTRIIADSKEATGQAKVASAAFTRAVDALHVQLFLKSFVYFLVSVASVLAALWWYWPDRATIEARKSDLTAIERQITDASRRVADLEGRGGRADVHPCTDRGRQRLCVMVLENEQPVRKILSGY